MAGDGFSVKTFTTPAGKDIITLPAILTTHLKIYIKGMVTINTVTTNTITEW